MSSLNEVRLGPIATVGRRTKVPEPGTRSTRPSAARASRACRTVIRLTSKRAARSFSDGRRKPTGSSLVCSRRALAIAACLGVDMTRSSRISRWRGYPV
jgi:hypothetical protein